MRELAEERGYDLQRCYAYSDSITDEPMLAAVGHPFAVNPDRDLRRLAHRRGWPVLVFDKPVALRSRVRLPAGPTARRRPSAVVAGGLRRRRWPGSAYDADA